MRDMTQTCDVLIDRLTAPGVIFSDDLLADIHGSNGKIGITNTFEQTWLAMSAHVICHIRQYVTKNITQLVSSANINTE